MKYNKEILIENLEKVFINLGKIPSKTDLKKHGILCRNPRAYLTHFGSWANAIKIVFGKDVSQSTRRRQEIPCLACGRLTKNNKFCSRSCSAKTTNLIPKRKAKKRLCEKCDKVTNRRRKTCHDCKERKLSALRKTTLAEYHDKPSIKNKHPSWRSSHVRALARSWHQNLIQRPCANCGYDKHVELCHLRAITDFPETATMEEVNSKDNIVQLCRNCHWELDNGLLVLGDNSFASGKGRQQVPLEGLEPS